MLKRILLSLTAMLAVCLGALGFLIWWSWTPAAPTYALQADLLASSLPARLRTPEEHDAVNARVWPAPYILEIDAANGSLLMYGAHHTRDPKNPQMADIERRWKSFQPTVALYEGRQRGFVDSRILEPLSGRTEAEKLQSLAHRDGVRLYSLEPRYEDEVAALLGKWSAERVALYFTMRVYWAESGGDPDDDLALHLLQKRTDVEGLRGTMTTVADIDRVWSREMQGLGDWRTLSEEPYEGWIAEVSNDSRTIRGEHLSRALIDLVRRGERVFVVVGSGHVIRTEPVLRAGLQARKLGD